MPYCSVEGCSKGCIRRYCKIHIKSHPCLAPGCDKQTEKGKYCFRHRGRLKRNGQLDLPQTLSDRPCKHCAKLFPRQRRKDQFCSPECYIAAHVKIQPNGCWHWQGTPGPLGYHVATFRGWRARAHRFCYRVLVGPFPESLFVCHTCDNPPCVNPEHLFVGNSTANTRDMDAKGRRVVHPGIANPRHVLTEQQVLEIYRSSLDCAKLGAKHNVSQPTVWRIKNGHRWSTVTGHQNNSHRDPNSHTYHNGTPPITFRNENP